MKFVSGNNLEQMAEINEKHTNTRYFKDVVLDEKIKAYSRLDLALENVDAILFVVPTKVTRLVAKQVAQVLKHKVHILHASKGLNKGHMNEFRQFLKKKFQLNFAVKSLSFLVLLMLRKRLFVTSL